MEDIASTTDFTSTRRSYRTWWSLVSSEPRTWALWSLVRRPTDWATTAQTGTWRTIHSRRNLHAPGAIGVHGGVSPGEPRPPWSGAET